MCKFEPRYDTSPTVQGMLNNRLSHCESRRRWDVAILKLVAWNKDHHVAPRCASLRVDEKHFVLGTSPSRAGVPCALLCRHFMVAFDTPQNHRKATINHRKITEKGPAKNDPKNQDNSLCNKNIARDEAPKFTAQPVNRPFLESRTPSSLYWRIMSK